MALWSLQTELKTMPIYNEMAHRPKATHKHTNTDAHTHIYPPYIYARICEHTREDVRTRQKDMRGGARTSDEVRLLKRTESRKSRWSYRDVQFVCVVEHPHPNGAHVLCARETEGGQESFRMLEHSQAKRLRLLCECWDNLCGLGYVCKLSVSFLLPND